MQAIDVNAVFARAEQDFAAGRFDSARANLLQARSAAGEHPSILHLLALVEKKRGDLPEARKAFERALQLAPRDVQLRNNFANLLDELGDQQAAIAEFDQALNVSPQFSEARYNRAIVLEKVGRLADALGELERVCAVAPSAKAFSAKGSVLVKLRQLDAAALAYDEAIRLEPRRLTALHGRARVAAERGDDDASARYRQALELAPDDLQLRLGYAEALEAEGRSGGIDTLAAAIDDCPEWVDGQAALARMRWEAGEGRSFARDLEAALAARPADMDLWLAYASALAGAELSREAAEAAEKGLRAAGDNDSLRLIAAMHWSEAGELQRADRLFDELPEDLPIKALNEMRHRIRKKEFDRALKLGERALEENPWAVSAWGMIGLLWRLTDAARAEWLHGQPGLVGTEQLALTGTELEAIAERLRSLHRTKAQPLAQSLRGGTQTRGRLFDRNEAEVMMLRDAIAEAVSRYWEKLPPKDPAHPLLRHRDRLPRFDGSWSVRLTDGGFHIAHVHPKGILSSACYLVVPPTQEEKEGWLEIGRPPPELGLPLGPLAEVQPEPGKLALFPSTLYHGTRPFKAGERLTAAFDIVAQ